MEILKIVLKKHNDVFGNIKYTNQHGFFSFKYVTKGFMLNITYMLNMFCYGITKRKFHTNSVSLNCIKNNISRGFGPPPPPYPKFVFIRTTADKYPVDEIKVFKLVLFGFKMSVEILACTIIKTPNIIVENKLFIS